MTPSLELMREKLIEHGLFYCVTCGATTVIELNHEPKIQYYNLGYMFEIMFITIWPQCHKHHNHEKHAEEFDTYILGKSDDELFVIYRERYFCQRDFVASLIARNIKI